MLTGLLFVIHSSANADAAKPAETPPDPRAPFSAAMFPLIEKTQQAMAESMAPIESPLADVLVDKTKKLLADKVVYQHLVDMAYERSKADDVSEEPEHYAKQALAAFNASLRLTPGVMGRPALMNRARLLSQVADYYSKNKPSMCRYIPADFSIVMSVDAPWVAGVDEDVFNQALDDEINAIKQMLAGSLPYGVNDSDAQMVFSKFAGEWLVGLDADTRYRIGLAKTNGNYCLLWKYMFKDFANMSESYPNASNKVLRPVLTMMSRGWLDSGLWSYEVAPSKAAAPAPETDEGAAP
jgi:hypothetical protein